VDEAHKNGLEIHVWVNTFTMWSGTTPPPESSPRHIYLSHPEWLVVDSGGNKMALNSSYVFATPGNPAVWDHIINVVSEIALKYNIDGIHFDYIRYPGPNYSFDSVSNLRYNEAKQKDSSLAREDWQRAQVTEFISRAYENIISVKPMLKVTAAVWGIYRNKWGWSNVSQGYSDYYQDSQNWMKLGVVDAISPMIYWPLTNPEGQRTDYATLSSDFMANSYSRFLFAGLHVYPRNDTDSYNFDEMAREIEHLRKIGAQGMAIYNYALLKQNNYFDELKNGPFNRKASVPPMWWK
ncbi:MAG: family 10 glycosylhydrolase, partial [Deltaproteobacteria bacterium]|nr:family 10 glycosylhydrolase [Deltaproteobacteria bacterium]